MASIEDRRSVGQEIVLRVRTTGSGIKVIEFDGNGVAVGVMTKTNRRYFYGDDAEEKATQYAYRLQEKLEDDRDCPVTVVELGEVMAEKLAEVKGDTNYEWEVSVTADVEHTPRVDADSVGEAEEAARKQIEEEYGVTADTVQHETELPDGRHQVCVWAERHLYESVVEATESDALEAGKVEIEREYAVQTGDIHGANTRKLREVETDGGGKSA